MPMLEYGCPGCGQVFENFDSDRNVEPTSCPKCGGEAERVLSASALARGKDTSCAPSGSADSP